MASGILDPEVKAPGETYPIPIDCSANTPAFGNITAVTATAIRLSDGSDQSASIIHTTSFTTTVATVVIKGGAHGEVYNITVATTFTPPNKTEDEFLLTIEKGIS